MPASHPPPRSPTLWGDPRHRLGLLGEEVAIAFLRRAGWTVEAHRFRVGRNDLDIVARLGRLVAFIEVKTRLGEGFGPGREAIGWRKRRTLTRLAACWQDRHGQPADEYRFDVVEVAPRRRVGRGLDGWNVIHMTDAWRPTSFYG